MCAGSGSWAASHYSTLTILSFVRELRASGVSKTIEIVSNGSLLPRASDDLFREIDSLSISWYPDPAATKTRSIRRPTAAGASEPD